MADPPGDSSNLLFPDQVGTGAGNLLASGVQAAIDWRLRGGLAGSLGLEPAEAALLRDNALSASGASFAEQVRGGMDNPLLNAFGPGSIRGWHGTPHLFEPEPPKEVAVPTEGISVFHGTLAGDVGRFNEGTHFGTAEAANFRIKEKAEMGSLPGEVTDAPAIYPAKLQPKKILDIDDLGDFNDAELTSYLHAEGKISDAQLAAGERGEFDPFDFLKKQGYDTLRYKNTWEDPGSTSYMVLDPSIIQHTHELQTVPGNPFGAFRDEAIGSGEGAQAYGWGHYVAGNPAVAEGYQKGLGSPRVYLNDKPVYDNLGLIGDELIANHPEHVEDAARALHEAGGDTIRAMQDLRRKASNASFDDASRGNFSDAADMLESGNHNLSFKNDGHLLEVHILPEESELLDWDKSIGEQPEGVRKLLTDKFSNFGNKELLGNNDSSGQRIYNWIGRNLKFAPGENTAGIKQDELASKALHEAGIPGIKYLDAGSRAAGEGTSNYVIFSPSNLRIIGRNGQRLEPVEGDPFAAPEPEASK